MGPLVAQEPVCSIDAFAARDEKGKLYLIWKEDGNSMGLPTNIWAQEMTEDRKIPSDRRNDSLFCNDTLGGRAGRRGMCF